MKNKSLVSITDYSKNDYMRIIKKAAEFEENPVQKILDGKVISTLFFEPSTRTRLSFESAINKLGGKIIGFTDATTSSVSKGESLKDTIKTVANYSDLIIMRHPLEGSARYASEISQVPIINAGDGANQHPTQTLLDLYSIYKTQGSLDNLNIFFVGDLKYGRVVHSQCEYLAHFDGIRFIFVSPEALKMPEEIVELLQDKGAEVIETEDLESVVSEFDVFSQTRVQKERFPTEEEYLKHKGVYIVTPDLMAKAKDDMILIHPLPRIDEIVVSVDSDHRAKYFKQVSNGVAVRMALIANLLKL